MAAVPPDVDIASGETLPYTLFTYFRSSCSARLRIALNVKSIAYTPIYINLIKGEQLSDSHTLLNPSRSVPVLIPPSSEGEFKITQSLSALEYIEEAHPDKTPLLPPQSDLQGRAIVRTLSNIIACDTQPPTNLRILERIGALTPGSAEDKAAARAIWAKELITEGLMAYEAIANQVAGRFSYRDAISMADVCLVPAVWGATRFGVDMGLFPTVARICGELEGVPEVRRAHWMNQGDTPETLRG